MEITSTSQRGARMKQTTSVTLATWMLEHLTPPPRNESLSGDLLEEFRSGRSIVWYWRQVVSAIAVRLFNKSRDYTLPLAFSIAWSMLYPSWQFLVWKSGLSQTMIARSSSLDWPYSSLLTLASGILPPTICIWFGFFIYSSLRKQQIQQPTWLRTFGSLSLSLNVFFISTIALSHLFASSGVDLRHIAHEDSYLSPRHIAISVPLALSLFSAILCAYLRPRHHHRTAFTN
jgi:hypothetical protein